MRDIEERYLWCRDVLHAWDPYSAEVGRNTISRRNEVRQVLLCVRCGTFKTRIMTTGGELLRNSYSYPSGYLQKDQGPLSPADRAMIRKMNLARNNGLSS
jgi:hypothetical protein